MYRPFLRDLAFLAFLVLVDHRDHGFVQKVVQFCKKMKILLVIHARLRAGFMDCIQDWLPKHQEGLDALGQGNTKCSTDPPVLAGNSHGLFHENFWFLAIRTVMQHQSHQPAARTAHLQALVFRQLAVP